MYRSTFPSQFGTCKPNPKKIYKVHFGDIDVSKSLLQGGYIYLTNPLMSYETDILFLHLVETQEGLVTAELMLIGTVPVSDVGKYDLYIDSRYRAYVYKEGAMIREIDISMGETYEYVFITTTSFYDKGFIENPIPDFYVSLVDNVGD